MAFADPQAIKIGGTTHTLPRVFTEGRKAEYTKDDGTVSLKIETAKNRRNRQTYRADTSKITTNPFDTSQNVEVSMSAYLVVDRPLVGYTNAEALDVVKGLLEALTEGTYADVVKLLAGES